MSTEGVKTAAQIQENPSGSDDMLNIYRHTKCPRWGLAIIAWDRANKRGYQFEDGKIRKFRKGFYDLFEPVDLPDGRANALVKELLRRQQRNQIAKERKAKGRSKKEIKTRPFEEQLKIFTTLYPEGFEDEGWAKDIRGTAGGRRLKRHRQPAVDDAAEILSENALSSAIEEGRAPEHVAEIEAMMRRVNLVTTKQLEPVTEMPENAAEQFLTALYKLLHDTDETSLAHHFGQFVRALRAGTGSAPAWQVATAFAALLEPDKHFAVHPRIMAKQAATFEMHFELKREPCVATYRRFLEVAEKTKQELTDAGYEPQDMLDVRDFIWNTLRPAADKVLADDD